MHDGYAKNNDGREVAIVVGRERHPTTDERYGRILYDSGILGNGLWTNAMLEEAGWTILKGEEAGADMVARWDEVRRERNTRISARIGGTQMKTKKNSKKATEKKQTNEAKLRATRAASAPKAPEQTPPEAVKTPKAPAAPKAEKKMSGLTAAHKVLEDSGKALDAKGIYEAIVAAKLWATKGLTPWATLYAAIITEIAKKGQAARFRRGTEKGTFEAVQQAA